MIFFYLKSKTFSSSKVRKAAMHIETSKGPQFRLVNTLDFLVKIPKVDQFS